MPSGIPIRSRWPMTRMVVRGSGDQSGDAFSDVTVSATTPTREGYSFTGWNTAADGTGVDYPAGSSYTLPASGTTRCTPNGTRMSLVKRRWRIARMVVRGLRVIRVVMRRVM